MEELEYFFGKIKLKMKKINKFFFINGLAGSLIFYYFVRKIQIYYEVDANLKVILLLVFMVAGIYFMKDFLLFIFTKLLIKFSASKFPGLLPIH